MPRVAARQIQPGIKKSEVYQVFMVDCPLECGYEGRRNEYEPDAYGELANHFRADHPGYVRIAKYRRTVEWELVEDEESIGE